MQADLRTLILSGAGVPARVHWVRRPQGGDLPAVTLNTISEITDYHMRGPSGYQVTRVQADVWASTYASADVVARAIQSVLSGYSGIVGATQFQMVALDGRRDSFDAGGNDADRIQSISVDLIIHHRENI